MNREYSKFEIKRMDEQLKKAEELDKMICQSCSIIIPETEGRWIDFEGEEIWACNSCLAMGEA